MDDVLIMPGLCMDCVWIMSGLYLASVWSMHGLCLGYDWIMYEVCMDYVWAMYGLCVHTHIHIHVIPICISMSYPHPHAVLSKICFPELNVVFVQNRKRILYSQQILQSCFVMFLKMYCSIHLLPCPAGCVFLLEVI